METRSIFTDRQTLLGVIIPVYNGSKYLEQAVRSVLLQPCKDVQVVIVNDGSTDESLKIALNLAAEDDRVVVLNQTNQGVSAARNQGIQYLLKYEAPRIAFLDADDVWVKEFYTDELSILLSNPQEETFHFSYFDGNQSMTCGKLHICNDDLVKQNINKFEGHFCSYIYDTSILKKYSIRFPVGIKAQEDEVFRYLYLSCTKRVRNINSPMFVYRSNSSSVVHSQHDAETLFFSSIIPAWAWAKDRLVDFQDIDSCQMINSLAGCETMKKTFLAEFISLACAQGYSVEKIKLIILESGLSMLYDNEDIWVDDFSLGLWKQFEKSPRKTRLCYRIRGIVLQYARLFRNMPLIVKKRYPISLKDKICT